MKTMQERTNETLQAGGGLFDFEDLLIAIGAGRMQSFSENDTWAVTQISNYPRKTVLEIVFAIGSLQDLLVLEPKFEAFARENFCDAVIVTGRAGWEGHLVPGWKKISAVYVKELK